MTQTTAVPVASVAQEELLRALGPAARPGWHGHVTLEFQIEAEQVRVRPRIRSTFDERTTPTPTPEQLRRCQAKLEAMVGGRLREEASRCNRIRVVVAHFKDGELLRFEIEE